MVRALCLTLFVSILFTLGAEAQLAPEKVDTAAISRIKDEGFNHSQAMELDELPD